MIEKKYFDPKIENMDRDRLEKLQSKRFKLQLKRCYENSEFYQHKFKNASIKPEGIRSLDDVVNIPVVTKQELRDEQLKFPYFGRYTLAPQRDWREVHPSTGTTGAPVHTIWSSNDIRNISLWTARTLWNAGVRPGDIIQNGFSYGLWVAGMSTHYAARELGCFIIPIGAAMTERQIEYLIKMGSTVLLCTPSFALHIAERLKERGISAQDISLKLGLFGGEGGAEVPATRKKIEEGLGIDAFDYYGLAEIGPTIASECEQKDGLHWVEDHLLIEVINSDTMKRCEEGEMGVLVISHLTKEATPLIRYWTNDLVRLTTKACACGRTHSRSVGGILGRADDMIIYKGAKFYPVQVEKVVRGFRELSDEFRIELGLDKKMGLDICTIIVELVSEEIDRNAVMTSLKRALKEELLVTPLIKLEKYGTLERTTFKAKRIVDKKKKDS